MFTRRGFLGATTATLCVPATTRGATVEAATVSYLCGFFKVIVKYPPVPSGPHELSLRIVWARIESVEIANAWTRMLAANGYAAPTVRCMVPDDVWKGHRDVLRSRGPVVCVGRLESAVGEPLLHVSSMAAGQEPPAR